MYDPNDVTPTYDDLEIDWEKALPANTYECDNCKADAVIECQTTGLRKVYGAYCKVHYDSLFFDILEGLAEPANYEDQED